MDRRALLVDPDNLNMRYNFACALAAHLKDTDAALDMLETALETMPRGLLHHVKVDPDLDTLRDYPRYKAMMGSRRNAAGGGRSAAVTAGAGFTRRTAPIVAPWPSGNIDLHSTSRSTPACRVN